MKNNDFISKMAFFNFRDFDIFEKKQTKKSYSDLFRKFRFENFVKKVLTFRKIAKNCFLYREFRFFLNMHFYISRYLPAKFEVIWLEEEPTD